MDGVYFVDSQYPGIVVPAGVNGGEGVASLGYDGLASLVLTMTTKITSAW